MAGPILTRRTLLGGVTFVLLSALSVAATAAEKKYDTGASDTEIKIG